jgi:hypothetical protein
MIASRRRFLNTLALASSGLAFRSGHAQQSDPAPRTSNGGTGPYHIPWLDKNGSHNHPAGPNLEPSHIDHFRGPERHRSLQQCSRRPHDQIRVQIHSGETPQTASAKQPSLGKKRVSPHTLRHACAMHTLHATGDIRKVARGSAMPAFRARKSTCARILRRSWSRLHRWFPLTFGEANSAHPTSYWRCCGPNNRPRYVPSGATKPA